MEVPTGPPPFIANPPAPAKSPDVKSSKSSCCLAHARAASGVDAGRGRRERCQLCVGGTRRRRPRYGARSPECPVRRPPTRARRRVADLPPRSPCQCRTQGSFPQWLEGTISPESLYAWTSPWCGEDVRARGPSLRVEVARPVVSVSAMTSAGAEGSSIRFRRSGAAVSSSTFAGRRSGATTRAGNDGWLATGAVESLGSTRRDRRGVRGGCGVPVVGDSTGRVAQHRIRRKTSWSAASARTVCDSSLASREPGWCRRSSARKAWSISVFVAFCGTPRTA